MIWVFFPTSLHVLNSFCKARFSCHAPFFGFEYRVVEFSDVLCWLSFITADFQFCIFWDVLDGTTAKILRRAEAVRFLPKKSSLTIYLWFKGFCNFGGLFVLWELWFCCILRVLWVNWISLIKVSLYLGWCCLVMIILFLSTCNRVCSSSSVLTSCSIWI